MSTNESVQKFIENFSFGQQKGRDSGLFSRTHLVDNHPIQISNFNESIENSKKKLKGAQIANNSMLRQNYFGQKDNCDISKTLSVYSLSKEYNDRLPGNREKSLMGSQDPLESR